MSVGVSYGGAAQYSINGVLYSLAGTMKTKLGGWGRTPANGPSGGTGNFTEKWTDPEIEVECYDDPAQSVAALNAATNVTVQLALRNGKTYMLYNAFSANDSDVDNVSGKFSIKMYGKLMVEIPAL